ncbi:MAG: diaminohydroxyphosphoribosylaminopyrimidine deaminase [Actinomycetota bacterium]
MNNHETLMRRAIAMAETARTRARPNPWVGAVLVCADGSVHEGSTSEPGGPHAEIVALESARQRGHSTVNATLYSTLEPCSHTGRTGPCTMAIIDAGITRVVTALEDPDNKVCGQGHAALRNAGIDVVTDVCASEVREQLAAYICHRRTNRPYVTLKMAVTMDGCATIPGRQWITGERARTRVHELRADADVIVTGMGTIRADNPELTVRHVDGRSPRRVVLTSVGSTVPTDAAVQPCAQWSESLEALLDECGSNGDIHLMVEAGPKVARSFHEQGLVDRYVFHVAPVLCADSSALPAFDGLPAHTANDMWRGALAGITVLDQDIEVILERRKETTS